MSKLAKIDQNFIFSNLSNKTSQNVLENFKFLAKIMFNKIQRNFPQNIRDLIKISRRSQHL